MPNPLQYVAADFVAAPGGIPNAEQLRQEFAATTFASTPVVFSHLDKIGNPFVVSVYFDIVPDATDEAAADAIVAAHTASGAGPVLPQPGVLQPPSDQIAGIILVGKGGSVDYSSIKSAIDFAVAQGASASNWYFIHIHPGTYTEDPMTVPTGVHLAAVTHGVSVDGVFVLPTTPASSLFTIAGGICTGINAKGVTGTGEACFKTTSATTVNACTACSADSCTNGFMADSGATLVLANVTGVITGAGQAITESLLRADNGGRILLDGCLGSAPSALLPLYTGNPIEKIAYADNGALISMVSALYNIAPKNASQVTLFADGGALVVLTGTTVENSNIALGIGSSGTGSKIVAQGSSLRGNTTDFDIQSATGVISASCSVNQVPVTNIVAGGVLTGNIFNTAGNITETRGPAEYRFASGRLMDLPTFYHEESSSGLSTGGAVTDGGGLSVDVTAGSGWVIRDPEGDTVFVTWSAVTALSITASSTNYIYYDGAGLTGIVASTSVPGSANVVLAAVVTDGSGIRFIHQINSPIAHHDSILHDYLVSTRKFAINSGLVVSQGTGATKLDIGSGSYYRALSLISYAGSGGDATWSYFYGTNGATEVASVTDLNTTQYDNAGTLTAMTGGFFRPDTVLLTSDGRISVVYGTAEYSTQTAAEAAGLGLTPTFMEESALTLALVIVEQGVGIASILDARPDPGAPGGLGSGAGGVTDHGALSGLTDDDHTQYLLTSGSRAMGGNLNMGSNNIVTVGTVDGVDVSAHAARHNPGGADALAVAVPVSVTKAANAAGVAASYSRSDHKHDVTTAAPAAAGLGTTSGEGVATTVARSDHTHQANTAPANVTKATAAIGSSTEPARADHKHDVTTAAPSQGIGGGNTEGSSTSLARADHDHTLRETGGPTNLTIAAIADGERLVRSGTTVRGAPRAYGEAISEQSTTSSTSPGTVALSVTKTASMPAGTYRLTWDFTFRRDSTASDFIGIIWDGSTELWRVQHELSDAGTDQRYSAGGSREVTAGAGAVTYQVRFFGSSGITSYIYNCHLLVEYVGP